MAEPSVSELTNIQGDAAIGAAANDLNITQPIPDSSLQFLQSAAVAMDASNRMKEAQRQRNLETSLARLDDIDTVGVFENDLPEIQEKLGTLLKSYYDNPDVWRNPLKNPEKYSELRQKEKQLRVDIASSKDQRKVYAVNQDFLMRNPAFNTDANQKKLQGYVESPRDQRELFQFDQPFTPDVIQMGKTITAISTVPTATAEVDKTGRFIRTKEGAYIDPTKVDQGINAAWEATDTFGQSNRQGYTNIFDALPEPEKAKYTDVKDFFTKNVKAAIGLGGTTRNTLTPNAVTMQEDSQSFQASEGEKDRALTRRGQDLQRELAEGKAKINPKEIGAYKNELVTRFWETGKMDTNILQSIYGNNNEIDLKVETESEDGTGPKTTATRKVPTSEVVGSTKVGDKIIIDLRDNTKKGNVNGGGNIERLTLSLGDISSDLNKVLGISQASKVADASRSWLKSETGDQNYDYDKVKPKFTPAAGSAMSTTNFSKQQQGQYKGKNITIGYRDGKWYNVSNGEEIK